MADLLFFRASFSASISSSWLCRNSSLWPSSAWSSFSPFSCCSTFLAASSAVALRVVISWPLASQVLPSSWMVSLSFCPSISRSCTFWPTLKRVSSVCLASSTTLSSSSCSLALASSSSALACTAAAWSRETVEARDLKTNI